MADRYLLESGAPDGYLLEDGSGVLILEGAGYDFTLDAGAITIAGQTVTATINAPISGGVVTIAGQTVTSTMNAPLGGGVVTVAGQTVTSTMNAPLGGGVVTIAGQSVTSTLNAPIGGGVVTIAGQDITAATSGGNISATLDAGAITIAGGSLDFAITQAAIAGPTPAGSSRKRRRYFVEIDGQHFLVDSPDEARQLLNSAYSLAEKAASDDAERVVSAALPRIRALGKVEPVTLAPKIETNVQTPEVHRIKAEISRIYAEAARNAELRLLMAMQELQDDEDETEELLLIGML